MGRGMGSVGLAASGSGLRFQVSGAPAGVLRKAGILCRLLGRRRRSLWLWSSGLVMAVCKP